MFDPSTHPDFQLIRLTSDDLTFDEMDDYEQLTATHPGSGGVMRAIAVIGLARQGVTITPTELGAYKIGSIVDVDYLAQQGRAAITVDPPVAGV